MRLREVRDRNKLIQYLIETNRSSPEKASNDADWFICCSNADMMLNSYRVKDLAAELKDGIPAFNPETDVTNFLETIFEDADVEDDEESMKEAEGQLETLLRRHFRQ